MALHRQISTIITQRHMDRGGLNDWYSITVLGVGWIDDQDPFVIKDLTISSPDIKDITITDQEMNALTRAMLYEFQHHINNPIDPTEPPVEPVEPEESSNAPVA